MDDAAVAQMRGDPLAAQENLDGLQGDPCLDLLMHEVVRDAVIVFGDLDVVVEIEPIDPVALQRFQARPATA